MKKRLLVIIFSILPLALLLIAWYLRSAQGPYFHGSTQDPVYAYLFNSLSISQSMPVGHIDHPGTPVQILGAYIINFLTFIRQTPSTINDVLNNPEFYLSSMQNVTTFLYICLLFSIGIITYRFSKNILLSLLMQLTPFFAMITLEYAFTKFSPESLVLLCSSVIAQMVLLLILIPNINKISVLIFSLFLGIGTATKLTFFPLLLVPLLLLPTFKTKLSLITGAIISFFIFTQPIVPSYPNLYNWVKSLFIHSGVHGKGETSIINLNSYLTAFPNLISAEPLFFFLFFVSLFSLLIFFIHQRSSRVWQIREFRFLSVIIFTQLIQIIIVAKHPGVGYLIPIFALSPINVYLIAKLISNIIGSKHHIFNKYAPALGLFLVFLSILIYIGLGVNSFHNRLVFNALQQEDPYKEMKLKYNNDIIITYFRASSPEYALKFGNTFASNNFTNNLERLYPNAYFWDIWNERFTKWDSQPVEFKEIIKQSYGRKIIFLGSPFETQYIDDPTYRPKLPLKNIFRVPIIGLDYAETLYEVDLSKYQKI